MVGHLKNGKPPSPSGLPPQGEEYGGLKDMKRYPHKAIIKIVGGQLVNGEWVDEISTTSEIIGRYDPSNNENMLVRNSHGDEIRPKAEFYTKTEPIAGAERLEIYELGVSEPIISWWRFQTHSVIYV